MPEFLGTNRHACVHAELANAAAPHVERSGQEVPPHVFCSREPFAFGSEEFLSDQQSHQVPALLGYECAYLRVADILKQRVCVMCCYIC